MMGLTWFILGFLTVAAGYLIIKYRKIYQWNNYVLMGIISGIGSVFFSLAWAVGAVLEGVPRAAGMGLLVFGMGGIVILSITFRFAKENK